VSLGSGLEKLGRIYWVWFGVPYYWIFVIQKLSKGGLAKNYFTGIIQTNTLGLKLIIFLDSQIRLEVRLEPRVFQDII
jgi:hypothetical protein